MRRRAQNIIEYAMLVMTIALAATVMIKYMSNAVNARFGEIRTELNESQR